MGAAHQLVQDDPQAEDIGASIDPVSLAPYLLRTHVGRRAGQALDPPEIFLPQRQAEVGQVSLAGTVDQQVGGLDIAVHQSILMGIVQRIGDRGHQPGDPAVVGGETPVPARQALAVDQFRDDETVSVGRASDVIDRDDMLVIQAREDPRLAEEGVDILVAEDPVATRDLDGHQPAQQFIPRQIDLAEPALSQDAQDAIAVDEFRFAATILRPALARPSERFGHVVVDGGRIVSGVFMLSDRLEDRGDRADELGEPPDEVLQRQSHPGLFPRRSSPATRASRASGSAARSGSSSR